MLKDNFKQIILDNQQKDYSVVRDRDFNVDLSLNKVQFFIGVRRCGKTHLMFSVMRKLMEQHGKESVLYINFEDDRIFPMSLPGLNEITEAYYELFPHRRNEKSFFFFDEIQQVDNWEKFIRRVYDNENCLIFISESSAKLLSKEISTSLRGRNLTTEVFPLSFKEFLQFKNIDGSMPTSKNSSLIKNALNEFLHKGGFPELVNTKPETALNILQEYINLIIYRDLIERNKVNNVFLMKHLVKICLGGTAELMSFNRIYNDLRSQGLSIARNTIYEYIGYLEDAFALFSVPVFAKSIRTQNRNPRKIFVSDTGFKNAVSFAEDLGKLYETAVFLHLRRTSSEIFYYRNKQEVDFWLPSQQLLINVAYNIENTKTYTREVNGLLEAMKELKINSAYLVNSAMHDTIKKEGKTIVIVPLWEWLMR